MGVSVSMRVQVRKIVFKVSTVYRKGKPEVKEPCKTCSYAADFSPAQGGAHLPGMFAGT